jgi:hypothetical protein
MTDRPIDPMSLTGEALRRWYSRSPAEVEDERQARRNQRYRDFFGDRADPDPEIRAVPRRRGRDIDPGFSPDVGSAGRDIDPGFAWAPASPNRRRRQPLRPDGLQPLGAIANEGGAFLDRGLAGADDGGQLIDVGNSHNPRLKNEHIKKYGFWPKTADGRDHDVAHRRAIADGGSNTLDNIEPMHPEEHKAQHRNNGDSGRWGRRSSIARAFGGRVEPPNPGPKVRGFGGILNPLNLLGIASGRIRTDNFSNFASDMVGVPSPEDLAREKEAQRRRSQPSWCPPGMDCV